MKNDEYLADIIKPLPPGWMNHPIAAQYAVPLPAHVQRGAAWADAQLARLGVRPVADRSAPEYRPPVFWVTPVSDSKRRRHTGGRAGRQRNDDIGLVRAVYLLAERRDISKDEAIRVIAELLRIEQRASTRYAPTLKAMKERVRLARRRNS